jgi:hypothetical protein
MVCKKKEKIFDRYFISLYEGRGFRIIHDFLPFNNKEKKFS